MSQHTEETRDLESAPQASFAKLGNVGIPLLVVGLVLAAIGYVLSPTVFWQSYLYGWTFWMSLTLGCFGLTLFHHTIRGSWGLSVIRIYEAGGGVAALLLMAALFLPIALIGGPTVYHWMDRAVIEASPILRNKELWLQPLTFMLRFALYFGIWIILAMKLRESTLRQDRTNDPSEGQRRANWSAPGQIVFVLTVTFAACDWVMSLDPFWSSTMFGPLTIIGCALAGLSFGTLCVVANRGKRPYNEIVTPNLQKDLGNLMFAFTLLFGYLTLSQFLIIWSGNLPEYSVYYQQRRQLGWNIVGIIILLGQFFAPFFALLAPRTKRMGGLLINVAILVFAMRSVDWFWNVMPFFRMRVTFAIGDFGALMAIGGAWLLVFASQVKKAPLLPQYDDRLQVAAKELHAHA